LVMASSSPVVHSPSTELLEAALFVARNSRARRILEALSKSKRMFTVQLLKEALGRVNNHDHNLLRELEGLGLIRRYPGKLHGDEGPHVVWNEITSFGRHVLEIVKSMES